MSVRPFVDGTGKRMLHVERVAQQGPGDRAGIRPGDIVVKIDGRVLQHMDDLDFLNFVGSRKPGQRLQFDTVRNGSPRAAVVIVGRMPEAARAGWELALQNARRVRAAAQRRR
jgi:S1-C subfamily serine protease